MRKIRWWPTILCLAAILWLTLAPHPVPDTRIELFEGADKVVHGIMFFVLTVFILGDIGNYYLRLNFTDCLFTGICIVIFAGADEWAQGAMGLGRTAETADFLADLAGIAAATGLYLFFKIAKRHRRI